MSQNMSGSSLISRVLTSIFFKSSFGKASRLTRNSVGILGLLKDVLLKSNKMGASDSTFKTIRYKLMSLMGLVKAYAKGDYREVATKSIVSIIAAFVYFVSPIDLIPDFIPMLGFADDMALLTFVFNNVRTELEKFELWEMNKNLND
jgi:uncharacterized membrane protein YkvA (DUF1232 family)